MAPSQSRHLLVWTLPTIAALLTLLWFKRRKSLLRTDPGGTPGPSAVDTNTTTSNNSDSEYHSQVFTTAIKKAIRDLETAAPIQEIDIADSTADESLYTDKSLLELSSHFSDEPDCIILSDSEETATYYTHSSDDSLQSIDKSLLDVSFCSSDDQETICLNDSELAAIVAVDLSVSINGSVVEDSACCNTVETPVEACGSEAIAHKKQDLLTDIALSFEQQKSGEVAAGLVEESSINADSTEKENVEVVCNEDSQVLTIEESKFSKEIKEIKSHKTNRSAFSEDIKIDVEKEVSQLTSNPTMAMESGRNENSVQEEKKVSSSLEEKLATLELETSKIVEGRERDSANHSPAEIMLASPSISNFSDNHSEGSSDSGKGCSDVVTPPPLTPAGGSSVSGDNVLSLYEFVLPQVAVGRLIGRHGSFLMEIRSKTNTNIFIKKHPETSTLKICAIEGLQHDIDSALVIIRQKFPLRRYPTVTLEKVLFTPVLTNCPLNPEMFHLQLVDGVNNDVILSSLISAGHFFLQQPTHPSYQSITRLNALMSTVYNSPVAPLYDSPVKAMGGWYRAQVVNVDDENETCQVKFLDYGGFLTLQNSALRQIRGDFLLLPFQAIECVLANVAPVGGEDSLWSEEARLLVQSLTAGQILQAQVYDYAPDGVPLVYLYTTSNTAQGPQVVLINEELVARGYAELIAASTEEPSTISHETKYFN